MKKYLSLFISFVMLFNLTAEVFAAPRLVNQEVQNDIKNVLKESYKTSSSNTTPSNQPKTYNAAYYEAEYQNNFDDLITKYDDYYELIDRINDAISWETADITFYESQETAGIEQLEKYENLYTSYNDKIDALGGMDKINKQYDLYRQYIALEEDMLQLKAEQENIIKENQAKLKQKRLNRNEHSKVRKAINDAQTLIKDYEENYFSKKDEFEQYKKDFIEVTDTYKQLKETEAVLNTRLNAIKEREKLTKQNKQTLLTLLPEQKGLTEDSDWNTILTIADSELKKLTEELSVSIKNLEKIEQEQDKAYQDYLINRAETTFQQAQEKACLSFERELNNYTIQCGAINGKINGHYVKIEEGSTTRKTNGSLCADVLAADFWKKQKEAWRHCINPSWDEEGLARYNAGITMNELSDIKYGEYLRRYGFEEGKVISDNEVKKIAKKLAKYTIGLAILDQDSAIYHFYDVVGDYRQSNSFLKYLKKDWKNKGYGEITSSYVFDEDGLTINTIKFTPYNKIKDTKLDVYYTNIYVLYNNTARIGVEYSKELNNILIKIMNFLSAERTSAKDLNTFLQKDLGINLDQILQDVTKNLDQILQDVNKNLEENPDDKVLQDRLNKMYKNFYTLHTTYTSEEKEDIVNKIQKRPFDPLMFALGPSHIIARNREVVRKRRQALEGFDLDSHADIIANILFINTLIETNKANFDAWNNLANQASKSEKLLKKMLYLGSLKNKKFDITEDGIDYFYNETYIGYEAEPDRHLSALLNSREELVIDLIFDILVTLPLALIGNLVTICRSIAKVSSKSMLKASIKLTFKSALKQEIKTFTKRSTALIRTAGSRRNIKNLTKVKYHLRSHLPISNTQTISRPQHNFTGYRPRFVSNTRNTLTHMTPQTLPARIFEDINISRNAAPRTGRVFNADLTKSEYQRLTKKLDEYEKLNKESRKAAKDAQKAAEKTTHAKNTTTTPKFKQENTPSVQVTKPAAIPEHTAHAKPAVAESKPVSKTASTPKPTKNRQPAKEPKKSASQVQEHPQGIATDFESNEIVELRKEIQRIETEKNAVIEEINTKLSNINGQHFENSRARAEAKKALLKEKKNIERFASKKIEELQNQINTLTTKTLKENNGRNAKIKDIIDNRRKFDADIEKVKGNSQIKPVPIENDPTAMYNYLRKNDLIFKSKRDVDIYIKRKSNKIFKDFNAFKTAYENPNHPLHKHAVIFSETDPAFMDVEFTISNKTPGFNTLESKELRIPVSKLAANYTQANNFINIKPIKNSSGRILGFDLLPIHTHGVNLDKYLPRLMNGDVLGVIRKTDKELLVIYDKVKNNEYVIGIIRENNQRGVNLLTTNYNVQTTMKGLGEQFIKYADTGDGMRKIIGFNQNEIIYLKQPSVSTIYNQNAPAELVKDIDKLVKDIKIGDTYKAWEP